MCYWQSKHHSLHSVQQWLSFNTVVDVNIPLGSAGCYLPALSSYTLHSVIHACSAQPSMSIWGTADHQICLQAAQSDHPISLSHTDTLYFLYDANIRQSYRDVIYSNITGKPFT